MSGTSALLDEYDELFEHLKVSEQPAGITKGTPYRPGGFDGERFYPFKDPAGKNTVAWGRYLSDQDIMTGMYDSGVSWDRAEKNLRQDMLIKGVSVARDAYNSKERERSWSELSKGERSYLSDIMYQAPAYDQHGNAIWDAAMDSIANEDHTPFTRDFPSLDERDPSQVLGLTKWRNSDGELIPDWNRWTRRSELLSMEELELSPPPTTDEEPRPVFELTDREEALKSVLLDRSVPAQFFSPADVIPQKDPVDLSIAELLSLGIEEENASWAIGKMAMRRASRLRGRRPSWNFNPFQAALGTPIMDSSNAIKQLSHVSSQYEFEELLSAVEDENTRDRLISENGVSAMVGLAAGAMLDPINLIPFAWLTKGRLATRLAGGFVGGGAVSAAQELPLSMSQYTRTNLESMMNITAGAVMTSAFAGLLGKGPRLNTVQLGNVLDSLETNRVGRAVSETSDRGAEAIATSLFEHVEFAGGRNAADKIADAIDEVAEGVARGDIEPGEAQALVQSRLRTLSESGDITIGRLAEDIEAGRRQADSPRVQSDDARYDTGEPPSNQPGHPHAEGTSVFGDNLGEWMVGYVTHGGEEIPLRLNADGHAVIHLDTPMGLREIPASAARVSGVRILVDLQGRTNIYDPNALLLRSPRDLRAVGVGADDERLLRVAKKMRERGDNANLDAILREEGYIGRVQRVADGQYQTRELVLFGEHSDLVELNLQKSLNFGLLRAGGVESLSRIDQDLGLQRGAVAGGSTDFMHRFLFEAEDGSVVLPRNAAFESMNNPWGVLYGPGPMEVRMKSNRFLKAQPVDWTLKGLFPIYRLFASSNDVTRRTALRLFENAGLVFEGDDLFKRPLSIETQIKRWNRNLAKANKAKLEAFIKYKMRVEAIHTGRPATSTIGEKSPTLGVLLQQIKDTMSSPVGMKYQEFSERVGLAGRFSDVDNPAKFREAMGPDGPHVGTDPAPYPFVPEAVQRESGVPLRADDSPVPEVGEAAKAMREELFDPMFKEMIDLNLVDFGDLLASGIQAESYMTRVYNRTKIQNNQQQFISDVKAHYMDEFPHIDEEIAHAWAVEVKNKILHSPEGRMVYEMERTTGVPRSQRTRARTINLPDEVILKWLEHDSDLLSRMYARTLGPDIELAKFMRSIGREETLAQRLKAVGHDRERLKTLLSLEDVEIKHIRQLLEDHAERGAVGKSVLSVERSLNAAFKKLNKLYKTFDEKDLIDHHDVSPQLRDVERSILESSDPQDAGLMEAIKQQRIESLRKEMDRLDAIGQERPDLKNMELMWKPIKAEYDRLIDAAGGDRVKAAKLAADFEKEKDTIIGLIHLLRGDYRHPWDSALPASGIQRFLRGLRRYNVLTMSGSFLPSSISDAARLVTNHGFYDVYKDLIKPLASGTANMKVRIQDARDMGIAIEVMLNNRMSLLSELGDYAGKYSKAETLLERGADAAFLANLMSPWNDVMKGTAGYLSTIRILRAGKDIVNGKTVDPRLMSRLRQLGIDEDLAVRMFKQSDEFGTDELIDGLKIPDHLEWEDGIARETFIAALQQEVDNLIITPSVGDKPFLMSNEMAKTLLQFQSFAFSATLRIGVSSLQTGDKFIAQALSSAIVLGMLSYIWKSYQYGRTPSTDPRVLLSEGIDRSGVLGVLSMADNAIMGLTGDKMGLGPLLGAGKPSPWAAQRRLERVFFGPSFGRLHELGELGDALMGGDFKGRHAKHIRSLMIGQNLFYADKGYDAIQYGMEEWFKKN